MRIAVLMPTYDEGDTLASTLHALAGEARAPDFVHVFVVDDGSETPVRIDALPAAHGRFSLTVARHVVNLGQGAALETARRLALGEGGTPFDAYVTMDADGQHAPSDVFALAQAIAAGADVAFGNRFQGGSQVPPARAALLRSAGLFERWLTGLRLGDAHNGLRAFSWATLSRVCIRQDRMAHATEIKQRVAELIFGDETLEIVEVPVSIRYSAASLQKGQSSAGAVTIVRDLIHRFLFEGPK